MLTPRERIRSIPRRNTGIELKEQFDKPQSRNRTPEYAYLQTKKARLRKRINCAVGTERDALIGEYKSLAIKLLKVPSKIEDDKKLVYCSYADDFLIGISGSRMDCESIKATLKQFLLEEYSLELSEEKNPESLR